MAEMVSIADAEAGSYAADLSRFTQEQINEYLQIYRQVDANGDGMVSVRELKRMFSSLGFEIPKKVLRRLIRIVDTDHNGALSFDEFISLLVLVNDSMNEENNTNSEDFLEADFSQFTPEEIEHFRSIFRIVDANNDGTVSIAELSDMFLAMSYNVPPEVLTDMIRVVDSDLSGNLCFEEFVALVILVNQSMAETNAPAETYEVDISSLSHEEIEHFFSLFRTVDTDHSGTISVSELDAMFIALNLEVTPEMLVEMVSIVDTDRSGNLSFKEFISLIILVNNSLQGDGQRQQQEAVPEQGPRLSAEDEARFRDLFDSVDTDGSNSISTSELGSLFTNLGYETTEDQMRHFIAMVDTDGDGVLNFNEFAQLIIYYLESQQQSA